MDKYLKLLTIGVPGELCVGGPGVARGYLFNQELTSEKFVINPYKIGESLYRSGDLARLLPDGDIEYLGRIDHQVKIRGFRIELGEIESRLLGLEGVKESVVLARDDSSGGKYLAAYLVSEREYELGELRKELSRSLPEYMIPSYFVFLEKIPLTSNGKVDRHSLPEPEIVVKEYVAPKNDTEAKLVEIWSEVLGIDKDKISTDSNFFELGGHSLRAVALFSKIKERTGVTIKYNVIFENPDVSGLAAFIQSIENKTDIDSDYFDYNSDKEKVIFVFPTLVSYGLSFFELSAKIPEYRIIAFNYIEDGKKFDSYRKLIIDLASEKEIILLGYSASYALQLQTAYCLEDHGIKVSKIIMLDSRNLKNTDIDETVTSMIGRFDSFIKANGIEVSQVLSKMEKHADFIKNWDDGKNISPDIFMIKSESSDVADMKDFENITHGKYIILQGKGLHTEMLEEEFIEENVRIIESVLKNENVNSIMLYERKPPEEMI